LDNLLVLINNADIEERGVSERILQVGMVIFLPNVHRHSEVARALHNQLQRDRPNPLDTEIQNSGCQESQVKRV
jgi:hypothetical protein